MVVTLYFDNMIDIPYEILYDLCNRQSDNGILQEIFPYVAGIPTRGKNENPDLWKENLQELIEALEFWSL